MYFIKIQTLGTNQASSKTVAINFDLVQSFHAKVIDEKYELNLNYTSGATDCHIITKREWGYINSYLKGEGSLA